MRTAALRFCLSGLILSTLPTLTHAALEYSVKSETADLFRARTMEPPPVATLEKGESLKLIFRGASESLVETGSGVKGWIGNGDLHSLKSAPGQKVRLADQKVTGGGEYGHSEIILHPQALENKLVYLDRSFSGEITEAIDKEQLEMSKGEN